ncbi:MAG: VCBS repeat-containing protein [Planctomycetes bacterium]|nr:VCBS repeat-containing protein [Planctomycetota bacterium]
MKYPRLCVLLGLALFSAACARHKGGGPGVQPPPTPRFETRIEIAPGSGGHSDYALVDLDNDSDLDLAVISLTGELRILLGGGNGTFAAGQELNLGGGPIWVAAADFDRDGDQDLAVVRDFANQTSILLNNGLATFAVAATLPVGSDALAVVIGDTNDDDLLDVLVSRPVSPEILVHHGDGHGQFVAASPIALPGGGVPMTMRMGEVTGDTLPDLVVSDPHHERVLLYRGETLTGPETSYGDPIELMVPGSPGATSIGDLTGDGVADLAVSAYDAARFVVITDFDRNGPGGVRPFTSFDVPLAGPASLSIIADVTGDGRQDLVGCIAGQASIVVVPQSASGQLGEAFQLDATGLPLRPSVGDVDRNGRNDLLILSGLGDRLNLWLARSGGELIGARNYDSGLPQASYVAGGDFDRDGVADTAVGGNGSSRVSLLRRRADGALVPDAFVEVGRPVFNLEAIDLDTDGRLDLVVPVAGGVKLLHNVSSPGQFAFEVLPGGNVVLGGAEGPFGVAVADYNRDGSHDIAVADFRRGEVSVLLGSPQPFEFPTAPLVLPVGGGPVDVVAADFTGEGIVDLAVSRANQGDILILRNDGNAGFTDFINLAVGTAPNYLVTADFNGDRRSDLVVSNGNDASVTVLFAGANGFTSQRHPAGQTPTALLARDLTNDGLPDILVASLVGGDFRVLVGDGVGGFAGQFGFPGTSGATGAVLQDLNGDARPELLIASQITTRVSVVNNITQ